MKPLPANGIAIFGNSGSGKSTLANWLAGRSGARVLDLDTIAWGETAVRQPFADSITALRAFCEQDGPWIIEGCYGELVEAAFEFQPLLIFMQPGETACLDHCRARPWEPHKYDSEAEQEARLGFLLEWVSDYYVRDGEMSLAGHTSLFDSYQFDKLLLEMPLDLSAPPASVEGLLQSLD